MEILTAFAQCFVKYISHRSLGNFMHFSLQRLSRTIKMDGERRCAAVFRSLQKCSTGLKFRLRLSHSQPFICAVKHVVTAAAVVKAL